MEVEFLDREQKFKMVKFRGRWNVNVGSKILKGKTKNGLILELLREITKPTIKNYIGFCPECGDFIGEGKQCGECEEFKKTKKEEEKK